MLSVLNILSSGIEQNDDHELQENEDEDMHEKDIAAMSKAEIRKSNKPIMEKRRRARINTCLNELKTLILDALKKDPSRHSKLEKADILEMTVKHLQAVQRQQLALAVTHDPSVLSKFKGGFAECAQEITRYISRIDGVDSNVRQRLLQHLNNCTSSLSSMNPLSFTAMAGLPMSSFVNLASLHPPSLPHGDLNNNQARLLHRFVAARLAAAGDTAGAALLLQGGLSMLARGGPPPQAPHQCPPPPPPIPPQTQILSTPSTMNEGASASSSSSSVRLSAFTAVKRSTSPAHSLSKGPQQPKVLTPTALRPLPCNEGHNKTLVKAQVALRPVPLQGGEEVSLPLDFSFRRNSFGVKRPLEDPPPYPVPTKVLRVEKTISSQSSVMNSKTHFQNSAPSSSRNVPESKNLPSASRISADREERPDNPNDGEDKDMWRPW